MSVWEQVYWVLLGHLLLVGAWGWFCFLRGLLRNRPGQLAAPSLARSGGFASGAMFGSLAAQRGPSQAYQNAVAQAQRQMGDPLATYGQQLETDPGLRRLIALAQLETQHRATPNPPPSDPLSVLAGLFGRWP